MDNNKVDILSSFGGYFKLDDLFVSKQTFGFWAKIIDEAKIHNDIVNLDKLNDDQTPRISTRVGKTLVGLIRKC